MFAPGSTDLLVTEILLGDGTGTNFTFSTRLLVGPVQDKFAIDDFDGDGRPDLGILRLDSPVLVVLLNNCGAATSANLGVELQGPASLANGATGTYVATVTNHGPDLVENAFVAVALPPGMTPVSVTADVGGCDVERHRHAHVRARPLRERRDAHDYRRRARRRQRQPCGLCRGLERRCR